MKWSDTPWSKFSETDYTPEQYAAACIIDLNPRLNKGGSKEKKYCYLPYKEPDGTPNINGLFAAAGGRGITRIVKPDGLTAGEWAEVKRAAARKIISLYRSAGKTAPVSIYRIAGEKPPSE